MEEERTGCGIIFFFGINYDGGYFLLLVVGLRRGFAWSSFGFVSFKT